MLVAAALTEKTPEHVEMQTTKLNRAQLLQLDAQHQTGEAARAARRKEAA